MAIGLGLIPTRPCTEIPPRFTTRGGAGEVCRRGAFSVARLHTKRPGDEEVSGILFSAKIVGTGRSRGRGLWKLVQVAGLQFRLYEFDLKFYIINSSPVRTSAWHEKQTWAAVP